MLLKSGKSITHTCVSINELGFGLQIRVRLQVYYSNKIYNPFNAVVGLGNIVWSKAVKYS